MIVATFKNPTPGERLIQNDVECIQGENTFKVVASNDEGNGLEKEVKVFIGPDVPGRCQNIHVVEKDGKAVLTWESPTEGANGGYVNPAELTYFVARQNFRVTVANMGATSAANFTVSLSRDGSDVSSVNGRNLEAGAERVYEITLIPDVSYPDVSVYRARVDFFGDTDSSNNVSDDLKVIVVRPAFPVATGLTGSVDEPSGAVNLTWSAPDLSEAPRVTDDFEDYSPFLISGFGDWLTVDVDGQATIYFENVALWANCTMPQAYIVFNPSKAGLDPAGNPDDAMFMPYSGNQMLVSFASAATNNDDWLVSTRLSGKAQEVSFMIRSLTTYYMVKVGDNVVKIAR